MSSWGPGTPDFSLSGQGAADEDPGEEEGQSPSDDEGSTESESGASESPQSDLFDYERGTAQDAIRPGEYAFLPVFGFNESNIAARKYTKKNNLEDDGTTINLNNEPLEIGGKELTWWEDDSIMPKHPFMLVNPLGFASVDPDVHNFRDVFRCSKGEQFVFSDSGGYQIMSMPKAEVVDDLDEHRFKEYRVFPERLVEWQTENADAGATIDFPPYNISGDSSFPDSTKYDEDWRDFFKMRRAESMEMTHRMAKRLAELREEDRWGAEDYIFSPVIHGKPHPDDTHQLVRSWHETQAEAAEKGGVDPRGWVLKPEPSHNFGQIAMFLGYAAEHLQDAEFIHVLMVGGILQKTLLMYYAMLTGQFVTSDASSYAAGGMRRQFDLPGTATRRSVIISSRDEDDENAAKNPNELERYPCRCIVCDTVEKELGFDFVREGSGSARSVTMNLHNLHQALNIERTLDALLREQDIEIAETDGKPSNAEFWRLLNTIGQEKRVADLYRAMDYVRLSVERGLSTAERQYRIYWERDQGVSISRAGNPASETSF